MICLDQSTGRVLTKQFITIYYRSGSKKDIWPISWLKKRIKHHRCSIYIYNTVLFCGSKPESCGRYTDNLRIQSITRIYLICTVLIGLKCFKKMSWIRQISGRKSDIRSVNTLNLISMNRIPDPNPKVRTMRIRTRVPAMPEIRMQIQRRSIRIRNTTEKKVYCNTFLISIILQYINNRWVV